MFGKSSTAFEVQIRREGRWTIEGTFDDERRALSSARSWLAVSGVEEVKVLSSGRWPGCRWRR